MGLSIMKFRDLPVASSAGDESMYGEYNPCVNNYGEYNPIYFD
jgi:hypothetical protein